MRRWIAVWAVLTGFLIGFFDVPRPIEDGYRMIRASMRPHASDGRTVIVAIDDRSLSALGVSNPPHSADARVLDTLFAAGARRVVFDRAMADAGSPAEDAQLVAALARHRGRTYIGSLPEIDYGFSRTEQILTHPRFIGKAEMVSMVGYLGPFSLSFRMPTVSVIEGKPRPSISALLAGKHIGRSDYRPDFSIKPKSIPLVSYIDVLRGTLRPGSLAGKDVIIAPANLGSPDRYRIQFIGSALGAQIHAIGAQTLREGYPRDLGFLPALALAAAFVMLQARSRRPSRRWSILVGALIVVAPIALDYQSINIDVVPALFTVVIGGVRLRNLARKTYRGETSLLRIEQIHSANTAEHCDIIALKIRNFATISAILSPREIERLLEKLKERLGATEVDAQFAFDKDTLVWMREKIALEDREGHLRGLHSLFRTSIAVGSQAPDVATAIGLDANYGLPLRERIEGAIQSAEDAAHNGNLFVVGEHEEDDRAWRLGFFTELASAIETGDLTVVFQPKVNLKTGAIVGAEALLRWNHPKRGQIDPARIVHLAEEHNRIDMVTRFVLDRALAEAGKAIARDAYFKIAVNISALDLRDPAFAREVGDALRAHNFPAENLILEITETAPIENDQAAAALLAEFQRMGVRLSVDDFGTGHASLHYLRQIPSHEVKIDRSFVSGMMESVEDQTLVRTSIEMIHSLGRIAVAEGVETEDVARLLVNFGCDKAQGYYFSRATSMTELLPKLAKGAIAA